MVGHVVELARHNDELGNASITKLEYTQTGVVSKLDTPAGVFDFLYDGDEYPVERTTTFDANPIPYSVGTASACATTTRASAVGRLPTA